MIDKATQIRKLLNQGKTTREIAQKLRVSLRDIHKVREQEGIDIGALERQKTLLEKDIVVLNKTITQKKNTLAQLEKQTNLLGRKKTSLEAEIEKKQAEIKCVQQPVEPIYFPQNYDEVGKYLQSLSLNQLLSISRMITDILNDRVVRAIGDERSRMRKENEDNINRIRSSLRL